MKIKSLIFVFFSFALFIIFIVTIESFKDEKQFGAAKELQIEILYINNKPWTVWRGYPKIPKNGKGIKEGTVRSSETGSIEKGGEGGEESKVVKD
ncbi:unnamed protein product [Lathyrus oleraceus]